MGRQDFSDEVRISFQLSRAEYVRGVRFYLRKSHLVSWVQILVLVLALACAILMTRIMERLTFLNTLIFVLVAMVTAYGAYLYLVKPGHIFDRNPTLSGSVTLLFTREDVTRQDEQTAAILDWRIHKLWRGEEFYYLFDEEGGYALLPLRAFESEEYREYFERLALDACPNMKFRKFG